MENDMLSSAQIKMKEFRKRLYGRRQVQVNKDWNSLLLEVELNAEAYSPSRVKGCQTVKCQNN